MSINVSLPNPSQFTDYSDFADAIQSQLDRDDLGDEIPRWVGRVEERLNRQLRVPEMEKSATITLVDGKGELPADFLQARYITKNGARLESDGLSIDTDRPGGFGISGASFEYGLACDGDVDLRYYAQLPALGPTNPINWLLLRHGSVYFFGVLFYAETFLSNQEAAAGYLALWDGVIAEMQTDGHSRRWSGGPLFPRGGFKQVPGVRA